MDPVSLPDPSHTPIGDSPCHGPYEQQPTEDFLAPVRRAAMLQAALDGVALGAWDQRILAWLCHWSDTPTFLAILGWIERAHDTAQSTHTTSCKHRTFDTYRLAMIDALEEARDTARLLLDHSAPHLDPPPAGLPAWIYERNGCDTRPELPAGA